MNINKNTQNLSIENLSLNKDDKQILDLLEKNTKQISDNLKNYMFHEAAQNIYHFFWHDFCDIYLETAKERLNGENETTKNSAQFVLLKVLSDSLKLLHPFMPFITEVIWKEIPLTNKKPLISETWPG
jgi:valyl-tRNA synthetase